MSGVSGWGLKPPASTLRGKEGYINTKCQQWRYTLSMGWATGMLPIDVLVNVNGRKKGQEESLEDGG